MPASLRHLSIYCLIFVLSTSGPELKPLQNFDRINFPSGEMANGKVAQLYARSLYILHLCDFGSYCAHLSLIKKNGCDIPLFLSTTTSSMGNLSFNRSYSCQVTLTRHSCEQHHPQRIHFHRVLFFTGTHSIRWINSSSYRSAIFSGFSSPTSNDLSVLFFKSRGFICGPNNLGRRVMVSISISGPDSYFFRFLGGLRVIIVLYNFFGLRLRIGFIESQYSLFY